MTDYEQLIGLVKRHPVLYDISIAAYRDHTVRHNAWEEIAEKMNTDVEDAKDKWAKLRNCFTNALKRRRKKSGQGATNTVPWKFEKQMGFLLPHIKTTSNYDDDPMQEFEFKFCEDPELSHSPTILHTPRNSSRASTPDSTASFPRKRKKKNDQDSNLLREMVDVLKASQNDIRLKRPASDMDENDYFFLSMSKQLNKLPEKDQAEIKFQIHKLIHDSEMKMLRSVANR